ncbi:MAG: tetratricopeptide repeat protein [Gammaproteobacteria bacterium SHHR-1]
MIEPPITQLRQLMEQQDYPALQAACQAAEAAHSHPSILPLLALARAQLGEIPTARETLQQAEAAIDQLDADARTDLAGACLLLYRLERATDLLNEVLAEQPDHDLALARMGFACMARGELDDAATWFERSLQHNPERITVLLNRIHLHLQQQELSEAEARLAQAEQQLATRQGLPEAIRNQHRDALDNLRLSLWVKQGETAEAEAWVAEQGDVAGAQAHFARVLAENDRHDQAEAVLKEGLRSDPDNEALTRQFIELAQLQGRSHQAVHLIERRIARDKENPEWWIALVGPVCQTSRHGPHRRPTKRSHSVRP